MASFRQEQGQGGIEYFLVVGAVVVAMLIAAISGGKAVVPQVLGSLCPSVDTAADPAATTGSCLVP